MRMEKRIRFAENLKQLRRKANLTRRELAQQIGYTDKAVEKWEAGQSQPPLDVICRIADVLGVRLEELVFERSHAIRYFLGIDGGGTKTTFLLEDAEGNGKAQCVLGPSNPNDIGMERCLEILRAGIDCVTAGMDRSEIAVFAGIAGSLGGDHALQIRKVLEGMQFGFASNGSDTDNALELCLRGGDGVAVIAGTGSVAFAQNHGERKRVGGWGYLLDSGGSGYNLGRDALEAAFRAHDGRGPETILHDRIEAHLKKPLEDAVPELYGGGKRLIASLAPLVFEACDEEDAVATDILEKNADYLAELIRTAAGFVEKRPVRVVVCGGLAARSDLLEGRIKAKLDDTFELGFCNESMVRGAVMCAGRKYAQYRKTK